MHLLIKPENMLVNIIEGNNTIVTEFVNLYRDHSQPHEGDAGLDLFIPEDIIIEPNACDATIDFKIQCEAFVDSSKETNCWYYLMPRSSISKTPLRMSNSIGVIDAGYRGNLMAVVDNISDEPYNIQKGQRLFQICGRYLEPIHLTLVETLSDSERGNGGFGSTGS